MNNNNSLWKTYIDIISNSLEIQLSYKDLIEIIQSPENESRIKNILDNEFVVVDDQIIFNLFLEALDSFIESPDIFKQFTLKVISTYINKIIVDDNIFYQIQKYNNFPNYSFFTVFPNLTYLKCMLSRQNNLNNYLINLINLTKLYYPNSNLNDATIVHLPNLTKLNCMNTFITDIGLQYLQKLEIINCIGCNVINPDILNKQQIIIDANIYYSLTDKKQIEDDVDFICNQIKSL